MNKLLLLLPQLLCIILLSSCNKEDEPDPFLKTWQLVSIEKTDIQPPVFFEKPDDLPIKVLFSSYGIVDIQSYCNEGSAGFTRNGATLDIKSLHMTEKYCQINEPLDWEALFVYNFNLSEYYLIEDGNLVILTGGDYHLHFEPLQ